MGRRTRQMLTKDETLARLTKLGEGLSALGQVAEEVNIPQLAELIAQMLTDVTAVYDTVDQL